jgi:hypothetical protein
MGWRSRTLIGWVSSGGMTEPRSALPEPDSEFLFWASGRLDGISKGAISSSTLGTRMTGGWFLVWELRRLGKRFGERSAMVFLAAAKNNRSFLVDIVLFK